MDFNSLFILNKFFNLIKIDSNLLRYIELEFKRDEAKSISFKHLSIKRFDSSKGMNNNLERKDSFLLLFKINFSLLTNSTLFFLMCSVTFS